MTRERERRVSPEHGADDSAGLPGPRVRLFEFPAAARTNRRFASYDLGRWDRLFLPPSTAALVDAKPIGAPGFIADDHRSAIAPASVARLDGTEFYLSVKGTGSTTDPYRHARLDSARAAELARDPGVAERLRGAGSDGSPAVLTGEMWLRGSPYGGQGALHADQALDISERANVTSIAGFRIAPVLKVVRFPPSLEARLREVYWYRQYRGAFAQELRLVPSNVRVYFHGRTTVGHDIAEVFDRFGVTTAGRAHRFSVNFLRSGLALLTLFARTVTRAGPGGLVEGLDFEDVWLDKDAVVAPDGTIYFVDLEGIAPTRVDVDRVREKLEDQVYRSLYELTFALEQVDAERTRRFGAVGAFRRRLEALSEEAVVGDPYLGLVRGPRHLALRIRNGLGDESLNLDFPWLDQ